MSNIVPQNQPPRWKPQTYTLGAVVGAVFGFLAAYLYARAAEESAERSGGKPQSPGTGELIGLGLAALALIRQITELGKPPKKK
jgi:H+/Cl- antiporter ClcA